jgi:acyl CoA:acetate/3-ketoacid CoA transferase alpha subunit
MATAAKIVIVEVDEIVPVGSLDPETIITPSVFVDRIVQAKTLRS